jgi:hypothetical protein
MSTIFKSILNDIFQLTEKRAEKNGRHRGPINHDLTSAHTLGTPQNSLCAMPRLPGSRQEVSTS